MWKSPWQKLINRSEKIVCYPSSLINLRYLISDEITCVASQVRKLVGTQHPLLKTAKTLIGDTHGVSQLRGLLVLLISKTFTTQSCPINANQRSVAEIVETAVVAISIHKDLVQIDTSLENQLSNYEYNMQFGNKMATLCGDYLLASVTKALAEFQNTNIVDMISQGIGDTIESVFYTPKFNDHDSYCKHVYLSSGSLLSKCCKAAVFFRSNETDLSSKADEEIAENWAIHWCELYNICENIHFIRQQLSHEAVKSDIFLSKHRKSLADNLSEELKMFSKKLLNTKVLISNIHNKFPEYNTQSKEILAEMADLLCNDARVNVNLCFNEINK